MQRQIALNTGLEQRPKRKEKRFRLKPGVVVIHATDGSHLHTGLEQPFSKEQSKQASGLKLRTVVMHVTTDRITHTGLEQPPPKEKSK